MGMDAEVMPHIDQANIACGFHAGDPLVMQNTLKLAKQHCVNIGAHPAYPDLNGFGRRSMQCSHSELAALIHYQTSALAGMAKIQGLTLDYVKPHGALYNDMMASESVRHTVLAAVAEFPLPLRLMLQATPEAQRHQEEAAKYGVALYFEAFADRAYDDNGQLLSRRLQGAVHSKMRMLEQVQQLQQQGTITSINGKVLALQCDTLCVHGDNPEGVQAIADIRALLHG